MLAHTMNICSILIVFYSILDLTFGQKEFGDVELGCPKGSYRLDNYCYSISTLSGNYGNSEISCEASNGTLAMVKNEKIHLFLQKLKIMKCQDFWFGLTHNISEKTWHYYDGFDQAEGFFKWGPGEPNNYGTKQHCAKLERVKNLKWDDDNCLTQYRYICQFEGKRCSINNRAKSGSYCYELSKDFATHRDADDKCLAKGGFLAKIETSKTYEFIKQLIYNDKSVLESDEAEVGRLLRSTNHIPDVWIGVRYNDGKWVYSDDTVVNFNKWARGEPNRLSDTEECVVMRANNNWYDVSCVYSGFVYACQYNLTSGSSTGEIGSSSKLTEDRAIDQESGVHLSSGSFTLLLFVVFFLGAVFVPGVWGITTYYKNRQQKMSTRDGGGDALLMTNDDVI